MKTAALHNLNIPLTDDLFSRLNMEAKQHKKPVTTLAVDAIETWLKRREKDEVHASIAKYAAEHAETPVDLDSDLEAASIEHLLADKDDIV